MNKSENIIRRKDFQGSSNPLSGMLMNFGIDTETVKDPYKQYGWSYACIQVISTALSGLPLLIKKESDNSIVDDIKNPWVRLFSRPNRLMVGTQFWKFISVYYENFGQVFVIPRDADYSKATTYGQMPGTLEIADPRNMIAITTNGLFTGWRYTRGSVVESLGIEQVIRFFELDPLDILKSLAPSAPVATSINSDISAKIYNQKFFQNGGSIQGILTIEGSEYENMTIEEIDHVRADFDARFSSISNAYKTPVLSDGLKYTPTGATQKDMDFKELSMLVRDEVLAAYRVPKTKLGLTDSVDRATATVFERQFYTDNILPKARDFATIINVMLLEGTGYYCEFDYSVLDVFKEDSEISIKNAKMLLEMGYPLNFVNENQELGMPTINETFANQTIDTRIIKTSEPTITSAKSIELKQSIADKIKEFGFVATKQSEINKLSDADFVDLYDELVLEGSNADNYQKALIKYFDSMQKEQNKLIENIKDYHGIKKESSDEFLFDEEIWNNKLKVMSSKYIETAFFEGYKFLESEVGTFDLFNPVEDLALKAEFERKLIRVTAVNETMLSQIRADISAGISANETIQEITNRLNITFDGARSRSLTIARTEVAQSSNAARHVGMQVEGLSKKWVTSNDKHVRDTHKMYQSVGIKKMNYNYGSGFILKYPGDMDCSDAGEVINCRCITRAIRK